MATTVRVHHIDVPEQGFITRVTVGLTLPDGRPGSLIMRAAVFEHVFGAPPLVGQEYALTAEPAGNRGR